MNDNQPLAAMLCRQGSRVKGQGFHSLMPRALHLLSTMVLTVFSMSSWPVVPANARTSLIPPIPVHCLPSFCRAPKPPISACLGSAADPQAIPMLMVSSKYTRSTSREKTKCNCPLLWLYLGARHIYIGIYIYTIYGVCVCVCI